MGGGGERGARACTLSSCAIPWSVSAAWNCRLLARARFRASCSVSVSGAWAELGGCDSWAAIWTSGQIDNSKISVTDFPADTGDLLQAPTSIRFTGRVQGRSARFETLWQESLTLTVELLL